MLRFEKAEIFSLCRDLSPGKFGSILWLIDKLSLEEGLLELFSVVSVLASFFNELVLIKYFESPVIPIFDLVVSSVSELFFDEFPFLAVAVDGVDDFEVFFEGPVVPLDFGSQIIEVPFFDLF